MLLKEIYNNLSANFLKTDTRIIKDAPIYTVSLFHSLPSYEDDVLYIADDMCIWNSNQLPKNILYIGSHPHIFDQLTINWIQVEDVDKSEILTSLNNLFLQNYKIQNIKLRVMEMIMHGDGLNGVINEMAVALNTAIVIIDLSGKIHAYSSPFNLSDPLWLESVERGYCPPFFMEHLREVRAKNGNTSDMPLMQHCIDNQLYYFAKRVFVSGEFFGYVFMIQSRNTFSPFASDVLSCIADASTRYLFSRSSIDNIRSSFRDNLLIDMYRGISSDQIRSRLLSTNLTLPQKMSVAVVKPTYFHGESYVHDRLLRLVKTSFPNDDCVYFQKGIVILFALNTDDFDISEAKKAKLSELCQSEGLSVGISNPFSKVSSTKHYYAQALDALSLSSKLELPDCIHEYRDLAFYNLIDKTANNNKLGFYCHPALSILREYDNKNASQLYEVLQTFVMNGFNQNLTASALFLHRNTLANKKQKIISLTGIDFDNVETQFLLSYSFRIETFMEKIQLS